MENTWEWNNMGNQISCNDFGDLFIKVNVANVPQGYKFEGYDVVSTHQVSVAKAILGGKDNFSTLYGMVSSKIPSGVAPSQRFEIKGYGLPIPNSNGKKGKHIFKMKYIMPKSLNMKEKSIWTEFKKLSSQ